MRLLLNFSLAGVRLLIEGGSYSRVAFINFRLILHGATHNNSTTEDWFMRAALQIMEIWSKKKLPHNRRTKPRWSSAMPNKQLFTACNRGHIHWIEFTHVCGYYSRVAAVSFIELQVWLLFEGGYCSGCSFYLHEYGTSWLKYNMYHIYWLELQVWLLFCLKYMQKYMYSTYHIY